MATSLILWYFKLNSKFPNGFQSFLQLFNLIERLLFCCCYIIYIDNGLGWIEACKNINKSRTGDHQSLLNSNLWQLLSPVISFLWVIRLELTTSARSKSGEIVRRVWIYGQVIYKLWWCWDEEEREIYKHLDVKQWQISWPTTPVFYLSTFLLAVVLYHHSDITVTRF